MASEPNIIAPDAPDTNLFGGTDGRTDATPLSSDNPFAWVFLSLGMDIDRSGAEANRSVTKVPGDVPFYLLLPS